MEIDYLTTCGECGQQFDDYTGLSHHLGQSHKGLTRKEYYDRYHALSANLPKHRVLRKRIRYAPI